MLLLGVGLSLAVPPLSSPDEMDHVARGAMLADGHPLLYIPRPPVNGTPDDLRYHAQSGGMIDLGLIHYYHTQIRTLGNPKAKYGGDQVTQLRRFPWTGLQGFLASPGTGYYFPLVYAPHAVGIGLGKLLGLSVHASYLLMRVSVLLAIAMITAAALSVARPPWTVLAIAALPMSLFQAVSPVLDGVTLALALAVLCLSALALDRGREFRTGHAVALGMSVFLIASSRPQLGVLLIIPLLLAWFRRSWLLAGLGLAAGLATVAWLAYAIATTVDFRQTRSFSTGEVARKYLADPQQLGQVLANTLGDSNTLNFYWKSAFGSLGWLDAPMPGAVYGLLAGMLLIMAWRSLPPWAARGDAVPARVLGIFLALTAFMLTLLALLLTWTPYPAVRVEGVQGRYFLIPAMFLAAALGDWRPRVDRGPDLIGCTLAAAFVALSVAGFLLALTGRYG